MDASAHFLLALSRPETERLKTSKFAMELTKEQLKPTEMKLKTYWPRSQTVCGYLLLRIRVHSDPMTIFVDKWPDFSVVVCKPQCEQEGDSFKDIQVYASDKAALEATLRNPWVFDWTKYFCVGTDIENRKIFSSVATEKQIPYRNLTVCHMMILKDISALTDIKSNSPGLSLASLNESHIGLINQTWKFGQDRAVRMIQNMVTNFPSCCVLDKDGSPVSWILLYASCAMGMLYTLPEHRGKGYAKIVVSALAKRLFAEGYPVFCFIEEDNTVSYQLFKRLGFEDSSYKQSWFDINFDTQIAT